MYNISYPEIQGPDFEQALRRELSDNPRLTEVLHTLFRRGERGDCGTRLEGPLGFSPTSSVSNACRRIAETVQLDLPPRDEESNRYWPVLFHGRPLGGYFYWMIRPEVKRIYHRLFPSLQWGSDPTAFGYLFTWNPQMWPWSARENHFASLDEGVQPIDRWRCASAKYVRPGDHAFLMQTGKVDPGLVGYGKIISEPYTNKENGKEVNVVDIQWTSLVRNASEQGFSRTMLKEHVSNKQSWTPQSSGIAIRPDALDKLLHSWRDSEWNALIKNYRATVPQEERTFSEGTARIIQSKRIERNPLARQRCIEFHGARCKVCDISFDERYGSFGAGYIHVHHVDPLAMGARDVDPRSDLVPVCPNCHAMLHRRVPPFSVDELKELMNDLRS